MDANKGHAYFERGDNQNAPEVNDAYAVVEEMKGCADLTIAGGPAWFGWALREAYLRGVIAERERCAQVAEDTFNEERLFEGVRNGDDILGAAIRATGTNAAGGES